MIRYPFRKTQAISVLKTLPMIFCKPIISGLKTLSIVFLIVYKYYFFTSAPRWLMAEPDRIGNSREAEAYCLSLLAGERLENFYVIALNAKCHVLGKRRISMGSLSECSAYPRLVIETALNYNAHSVLLCHSHPGLTCAPSPEDISSTLQLQRLLNGVGVLLLDHLIIAGDRK